MKITNKTIASYLKNPHFCPKCKGSKISAMNFDPEILSQDVSCEDCGFVWREVFAMVSIEERY